MTGNQLATLLPGSFVIYPSLESLVLDDNLFTEIPGEGLEDLPLLTSLNLDGNPLGTLGDGEFRNLTALQELSVQQTPLTTVSSGAFEGLNNLQRLYLDDNQISELPADFFALIPQLEFLSLTGNNDLQTLPEGFFDPLNPTVAQIDITNLPWSCDCFLQWLGEYLALNPSILASDAETLCLWPPPHINQRISSVPTSDFQCSAPSVLEDLQDADILTNRVFTLDCNLAGAPFPEVTWTRDGVEVNYTERVFLQQYSGALQFADVVLEDAGTYQCFAININGSANSTTTVLTIAESTCFDGLLSSHETDVDCGGEFCSPCNISQGCLADRDCEGELVCLYTHQLPSMLLYISPNDTLAFTCAVPSVPPELLERNLQESFPTGAFSVNFTGLAGTADLHNTLQEQLAQQLQAPVPTISNVQLLTVERFSQPLYQVYFDLQKSRTGEQARATLLRQIDDGSLKATVRVTETTTSYRVRLNL